MPTGYGMPCTGLFSRISSDLSDHSQGGYFIINGSEKVLIAQERMAANFVYVFAKAQPSTASHVAEVTSVLEKGGLSKMSKMVIKLLNGNADKGVSIRFSTHDLRKLMLCVSFRQTTLCVRHYRMSDRIFLSCSFSEASVFFPIKRL